MSGRAGRRGKDDKGMCIMMIDDQMTADICRCCHYSPACKLLALMPGNHDSAFHASLENPC